MARIRTIKPEFFKHYDLFMAEKETGLPMRVAFAGLWTACDRDGRFKWKPEELKIECVPYDDVDFSRVLDALWTRGFIEKYASGTKLYGFIPSWPEHQHINNRESASTLPNPINSTILTREARVDDASPTRHDLAQGEGKGKEGKGREGNKEVADADSEDDVDISAFGPPSQEQIENQSIVQTEQNIKALADELYQNKLWTDVHAFVNKCKKHKANERAILHTLTRCLIGKPEEPWGYAVNIMKVEDQNFNERDYQKAQR